jgi:hypothetical protein
MDPQTMSQNKDRIFWESDSQMSTSSCSSSCSTGFYRLPSPIPAHEVQGKVDNWVKGADDIMKFLDICDQKKGIDVGQLLFWFDNQAKLLTQSLQWLVQRRRVLIDFAPWLNNQSIRVVLNPDDDD